MKQITTQNIQIQEAGVIVGLAVIDVSDITDTSVPRIIAVG